MRRILVKLEDDLTEKLRSFGKEREDFTYLYNGMRMVSLSAVAKHLIVTNPKLKEGGA